MVVIAVLAHRQDQHLVAGHRLVGPVQIGGAVGLLPQLVEEAVEHLVVAEIVVVDDVAQVILHAAHDLIGDAAVLLVHIDQMLLAEVHLAQEGLQTAEHGAVGHVVAVDHRDGIVQVLAVDGLALHHRLGEQGAGLAVVAVQIAVEVEAAVTGMLRHRIGQIGAGAQRGLELRNVDPCVHVLVLGKGGLHALRLHDGIGLHTVFGVIGIHQGGIVRRVRIDRILVAAGSQRQNHHKRHHQHQPAGESLPLAGETLHKAVDRIFHPLSPFAWPPNQKSCQYAAHGERAGYQPSRHFTYHTILCRQKQSQISRRVVEPAHRAADRSHPANSASNRAFWAGVMRFLYRFSSVTA